MAMPSLAARITRSWMSGALALLSLSCEPCAGTASCSTEPRVVLIGAVVEAGRGKPLAGVRLDVRLLRDGVELSRHSLTTGRNGVWEVRASHGADSVFVHATMAPGSADSYTVPPFVIRPTTRGGEATMLVPWTRQPYVYRLVTLTRNGAPLVHAVVHFTPTGGVSAPGATNWTGDTNGAGIFELPLIGSAVGDVIGTLTVEHPDLPVVQVIQGYVVPIGFQFVFPQVRDVLDFGG